MNGEKGLVLHSGGKLIGFGNHLDEGDKKEKRFLLFEA